MNINRDNFIAMTETLIEYIQTDRIDASDDDALDALSTLREYAIDHMTDADFAHLFPA